MKVLDLLDAAFLISVVALGFALVGAMCGVADVVGG